MWARRTQITSDELYQWYPKVRTSRTLLWLQNNTEPEHVCRSSSQRPSLQCRHNAQQKKMSSAEYSYKTTYKLLEISPCTSLLAKTPKIWRKSCETLLWRDGVLTDLLTHMWVTPSRRMCHALYVPRPISAPCPTCAMRYMCHALYVPCPMCVMPYMGHAV